MNRPAEGQVRLATTDDAAALAVLRYEFRASRRPAVESTDEFLPRCAEWMRPRLADTTRWRVWVLEHDSSIVGNVWLQLVEKLPNPNVDRELHGYVTNFFVRAEYRNGGAGSRLLRAVLEECERSSVDTVFLWPTDRSRSLYERHGFKEARGMLSQDLLD
jgi:N-acetylglutamate synthase-like GNAT family acetyltransferase